MNEENLITKEFIKSILPERAAESHKGTFGNVLNIAGSINYRGAAFLSTISPLKVGAGYVALASINPVIEAVSTLCPEAVFIPLKEKNGTISHCELKKILELIPKFKVISMGCGISSINQNQSEIENFIKNLLNNIKTIQKTVVIDADALNIIAKLNILDLPQNSVLTPHPYELSRLLQVDAKEILQNKKLYAQKAAQKYNSVVVLKSHETVITDGTTTFINKTGNSALAKAGSGDVLTGMISGYLAQGLNPINSAVLGVYLHGLCGETAAKELSEYCVNASDLIKFLPTAIKNSLQ